MTTCIGEENQHFEVYCRQVQETLRTQPQARITFRLEIQNRAGLTTKDFFEIFPPKNPEVWFPMTPKLFNRFKKWAGENPERLEKISSLEQELKSMGLNW